MAAISTKMQCMKKLKKREREREKYTRGNRICDAAMKFCLMAISRSSPSPAVFSGFHLSATRNEIILPFNSVHWAFFAPSPSRSPAHSLSRVHDCGRVCGCPILGVTTRVTVLNDGKFGAAALLDGEETSVASIVVAAWRGSVARYSVKIRPVDRADYSLHERVRTYFVFPFER